MQNLQTVTYQPLTPHINIVIIYTYSTINELIIFNQPKVINMDKFTDTISTIDSELVTAPDKEKGINQPGITEGRTYKDSNGNIRHKYETLVSLSPSTIASMKEDDTSPKGQRNEKIKESTKKETSKTDAVDGTSNTDEPKDTKSKTKSKTTDKSDK